jgi:hypothetical protein
MIWRPNDDRTLRSACVSLCDPPLKICFEHTSSPFTSIGCRIWERRDAAGCIRDDQKVRRRFSSGGTASQHCPEYHAKCGGEMSP